MNRGTCLLALSIAVGWSLGCGNRKEAEEKAASGDRVIAKIDGRSITMADVDVETQGRARGVRPDDRPSDARRRLLEGYIRLEVMANEARSKGYDKDPEVVRATKQQMINQLVKNEVGATGPEVPEASLQQYYASRPDEFGQRPFSDVRSQIQGRLASELRAKRMDEWSRAILAKHKVEIFEDDETSRR